NAQPRSADDLFREGTQLFARGEVKVACQRFEASYKLDAAPGTLFDLATCHEKEGRLWQARGEFLDFIDRATKAGKAEKAKPAVIHVGAIEARLPKVQFTFPAGSNVATVVLDGVALTKESWQSPVPVDAGTHTAEFQAPQMVAATKTVTTGADPTVTQVEVPILQPVAVPAPAPVAAAPPLSPAPPPEENHPLPMRTIGFAVGGAAVVALGVGAFFGVQALSKKSDANGACGGAGGLCATDAQTQAAQKDLDDARTSALVSTIGFGVGIAAGAAAAYLIVKGGSRSEAAPSAALSVLPTVGPGGGGFVASGWF
ncbi:MAG: hypothetical protein ACREJ3_15585, partial [Polyangiaceae bacterium]